MPSSPVQIGDIFANKYRVDRVLGEGGMGIVVAAHHLELDQPVAIKFLLDDIASQDEGAERFRREARAAAKIQSDHVVRVLDVGVLDSGERYMVMEYLEGRDLAEELADKHTFPVGIAAGFILEAIDAIGRAHAVGIVHRDLKPANLFLARRADGSQRIKVLDFGISKSIGSATAEQLSLTKTSSWIGSPLYMAPEQMQSARDVDHRADIWSLGAILYELISGRPPYIAESLPQLCNLLITTDPEPLLNHCPACPVGLANAVMSCLVRDVNQRIQSTAELAAALSQYATTITGSGLRASLMDRTELQMSTPPTISHPTLQQGTGASAISAKTHAAWGATDEREKKSSGSKLGLVALALGVAGLIGFFLMRGPAAPEEVESPAMAAQGVLEGSEPEKAVPEPEPKPEVKPPAAVEEAPVQPAAVAPLPTSIPQAAPRPAVRPAAPRPAAPKPKPQPTDDFAEFGGRR